ncbi:hypothetical protein [Egicoccus halophilus]|uniref:hypothetical protein n=1 Tax=Egicoccus halophilus TaxID=1670830 RepID=UPI001030A74C|nr:hypothetical protein [Egicoccus halophilus]
MHEQWSVEVLADRLRSADLRGDTLGLAHGLPRLYRELAAAVGAAEAGRRFDRVLAVALATT